MACRFILRMFFIVALAGLIFMPGTLFSQVEEQTFEYYDTTEYIPSFYRGALDYNLMIAASMGYTLEVERLVSRGAKIDAESDEGVTPLVFAVAANHEEVAKQLIALGANVNKITRHMETPLLIAVKNNNSIMTEMLIRADADLDFGDRNGACPLHYASLYGYPQIADMLLYYGAIVDKKSNDGITPLLASIWAGFDDVADLLMRNGANLEGRDNDGYTPLLMAAYFGDTAMIVHLVKQGVDLYEKNNFNQNALTLSIINDHTEAARLLLKLGNKWTDQEKGGQDPYLVASKYRRKKIEELLRENNVPGKVTYRIDQVSVNGSFRFTFRDIYTGMSFAFREPYLSAGFLLGLDSKLWYTRVLVQDQESVYHQYWNKSSMAYAGLFKDFTLTDHPGKLNAAFSMALNAGYSFGNMNKGTIYAPANKFRMVPSASFKFYRKNLSFNFGVEYVKSDYYKDGPLWMRAGISYNYFFDNLRTVAKTIRWN